MLNMFKKTYHTYENYMTRLGRERVREVLLRSNDRLLEDAGFSRALLESGVKAWPWRLEPENALPARAAVKLRRIQNNTAMRELQSYSDRELQDLGINRGSIPEVVKLGREGIERERMIA